jgi:hypothetical protein
MPDSHTATVILFWAQVVSGIGGALYVGHWMWRHAQIRSGDMTGLPMKYPRFLLGVIALSIGCGISGLWILAHAPKPQPCTSSASPGPTADQKEAALQQAYGVYVQKSETRVNELIKTYEDAHPGQPTSKREDDWINSRLRAEGIPFVLTYADFPHKSGSKHLPVPCSAKGTGIIGAHGETNMTDTKVAGFCNGIDLSPSQKATLKGTQVDREKDQK